MKHEPMNKLYDRNKVTGNFIIEVALDNYGDVFNEWDHSSYRKRDMDPQLAFFLEESSGEIPARYGLDLVFYLPRQEMDKEKESIIAAVVRNYYGFYADVERWSLHRAYRRVANYLLAALFLLSATYLLNIWQRTLFFSVISEGLNVGSWFCLWEAISSLIFERSDHNDEIKCFERLSKASISFRYDS